MALSYSLQSGNGATTNFVVPVAYLDRTHVKVFISAVETLAFTWVSDTIVQITPAPPVGVLNVEIRRTTPRDASLVDYINGSVLFDTDLDTGQLQSLFIAQEYFEQATSAFPSGHTIQSHSDGVPGDTIAKGTVLVYDQNSKLRSLPVVADGALLRTNSNDTRGVAWLAKGADGDTLEVEDTATGKLTWKQGVRKVLTTAGDLLYATGAGVAARLGLGTAGFVLTVSASAVAWEARGALTGDHKITFRTTVDPGWVLANDTTIGSGASGATGRANADTVDLYTLLWTNITDQWAPVTGGRGASATADYAANKPLKIPRALGLAIAGTGTPVVEASGVDAGVDLAVNTLTVANNSTTWITGMPVVFTLASGTVTGLTSGVTYYVNRVNNTLINLASSLENAQNGSVIDFTAKATPVWTITHAGVNRVLGEAGGEDAHAMSSAELLSHTHIVVAWDPRSVGGGNGSLGGGNNASNSDTVTILARGGNTTMNIMQPTAFRTIMIKL